MKKPSPRLSGRGPLQSERVLVVRISGNGSRVVELARGANRLFTGIGPRKPGGLVPVVMADGVRVFGVGLALFAGEDLRLLLEPSSPQSRGRRAVLGFNGCCGRTIRARSQRVFGRHVRPRQEVPLGRIV